MVNDTPPTSAANGAADDVPAPSDDLNIFEASAEQDETLSEVSADPVAVVAALRVELEQMRTEHEAQREQALRAVAESDNVRKRAQRDLENAHKFALDRFVNELLPVKDSLELGLGAAQDSANLEDLIAGTQMTLRMFATAVEKFGVRELAPVGEPFDPQLHQAMTTRDGADGQAPGTVLEVVQKGYLLNDRLVRPAMVVVSK
ncbi:MAG: molecular chaperone GrpE [Gammaproteobacteria bacterium]|jgi:molecular chaperone GrpE